MDFSLKDLDVRSILKDLLRNWFVILISGIACFLLAFGIYNLTYTPEYTSSATLAIMIKGNDGGSFSSLSLTNEMAGVLGEVFESDTLRNKVKDDLGVSSVNGKIEVTIISETNLMVLKAKSNNPKDSYLIIKSALENYDDVSDYLFSNANLQVLKEPSVPYAPSNPKNAMRYYEMAFAFGVLACSAAIALLSFLRPTVKNVSEAKRKLDGRIIGVIPFVKKYKTKDEIKRQVFKKKLKNEAVLISSPRVGMHFVESVKKITTMIERHMQRTNEKVLLISSVDENEGKSSVAVNIAISLANKGNKVLMIDSDLRKPALYKILEEDSKENKSLSKYLSGEEKSAAILLNKKAGVHCIYQFEGVKDPSSLLTNDRASTLIEKCRKEFDYIIIDSSPLGRVSDAENLVQYADAVMIVVREDHTPSAVINDYTDVIRRADKDFIGFVLNAFKRSTNDKILKSGYSSYYYGGYSKYSKN